MKLQLWVLSLLAMCPIVLCQRNSGPVNALKATERVPRVEEQPSKRNYRITSNLKKSDETKPGYRFSDNPRKSVTAEDDIEHDEHGWDSFITQVEAPEVKDTVREKKNRYKQDSTFGRSYLAAKNNERSRKSNAKSNSKGQQVTLPPTESGLKSFNVFETEIRNLSKQAAEHSFVSIPPPGEIRKHKNTHTDVFRRKVDDILSRNGNPRSRLVKFGRRQFRNVPKRIVKHRSSVSKPQVLNQGILRGNSVGQGTPKEENGKLTTADQTAKEVPSHDAANYNAQQYFPDLSGGTNAEANAQQSVNGKEQDVESLKEAGDTQKVTIVKEKSVHSTSTEEEQERVNIESNPSNERYDSEKLITNDHHIPVDITENHQTRKQDEAIVLVEGIHIPGKNYGPEDDTFGYYSESYKPDQPPRPTVRRKVKIVKVVKPRIRNQVPQNTILNNHGNGLSSQYIIRNHNDNLRNANFGFNNNHQPHIQPNREALHINHNNNGRGENVASDRTSNHVVLLQENRQHQVLNDGIKPPVFHQNQEFNIAPQQAHVNLENKLHGHLLKDGQQAFHSQSKNRNQVYIQLINTPEHEKRTANSNLNQKEEFKGPKTVFVPDANGKDNPLIVDNVQLIQVIHPQSEKQLSNHPHEISSNNRNVPKQRTVIQNHFILQQPEHTFNNDNENIGYIEIPVTHLQQLHISPEIARERTHTHSNNEGHISVPTAANNHGTGEQAYILLCDQNAYNRDTNTGQFGKNTNIKHPGSNVNSFDISGIAQNVDHYKGSEYGLNSGHGENKNAETAKLSEQNYNSANSGYEHSTFNTQTNNNHFKGTQSTVNDHNQGNLQGPEYGISEDAGVTNLAIPVDDSKIQQVNHGSAEAQGYYKGTDLQNPQSEQQTYKGQDFPGLQGQNKALGIGITVHNSGKSNAGFEVPQHQGTYDGQQQNSNIHHNPNFANQQSYGYKNQNNILTQSEGSYGQQLPQSQGHFKGTAVGDVHEQGYSQQNHGNQNNDNGKALGIEITVHASGNTGINSEDIQNHGNYNKQQKNLNGHYKGSDFSQQNFGHNQQNNLIPQYEGSAHGLIQPQGEYKGTGQGISHGSGQQQQIYKSIEHQGQNNAKALGIGIALHTTGNDNLNFGSPHNQGNTQAGNLNSHYKGTEFIQQQSYGYKNLNNPVTQAGQSIHEQGLFPSQGDLKSTGEAIIYNQQQYKNSGLNTGTHNQGHDRTIGFDTSSSPNQGFYNGNSLSGSRGIAFKQGNVRSNRQTPFAYNSGDSSFNQGKGSFQNQGYGFTKPGKASGRGPTKSSGNNMPYDVSYTSNKNLQQSEFLQYESLKPTHSNYQIEEPIDIILVEENDNSYQNNGGPGEDYYYIQQENDGNNQNTGAHYGNGDFYNVGNSNIEQQHSNVRILVDGGKDRTYPIRQLATVGLHVARNVLPHVKKSRAKSITGNINFGVEIKKGGNVPQNSHYNIESRNDAVNKTLE